MFCIAAQDFINLAARRLFMPVWSPAELLFAYKQLYQQHFQLLTPERVQRLMEVYGGSVRHVLAQPSQNPAEEDEAEFAQVMAVVNTREVSHCAEGGCTHA